jgi:hypothetical protein
MNRIFLLLALVGLTMSGCGVDWFPASKTTTVVVTAFSFSPASVLNAVAGSVQESSTITVALTGGTSAPISVTGGEYRIGANGTYTAQAGTVKNGETVTVHHTAAAGVSQTVTTTLTIGDKSASFSSTTAASAVTAFAFNPVMKFGAVAGELQISNPITVAVNSTTPVPISISGGEYTTGDRLTGPYTTNPGTVVNGATVYVHHIAGTGALTVTTLTIGDKTATFSSTPNATADLVTAFSFTPVFGAVPSSPQTSNPAVTVGYGGLGTVPISITGGEYTTGDRINGPYTSVPGFVSNGDQVFVRHSAAALDGTTITTTLTIGDKSATFSSTTAPLIVTQFAFSPASVIGQLGSTQTSNTVTIQITSGTTAGISITGGSYALNGSTTFNTGNGLVKNGDTVTVQHTAGTTSGQIVTTVLQIDNKIASFTSTAANITVPNFVFNPTTGASQNVTQGSNLVTIRLFNGSTALPDSSTAPISIVNGEYKITGSTAFTSLPGVIKNGDTVVVQHPTGTGPGNTVTTTLTIGGSSATYTSTTASP